MPPMSPRPRGRGGAHRDSGSARSGRRTAAEPALDDAWLRDLAARGRDPEAWERLSEDELMLIAYQQCLFFGATRDEDVAEAIGTLYRVLNARVPVEERNELLDRVTEAVAGGASNVLALLPFLQHEASSTIVGRAAQSFATLMPLTAGDEMTGPRTIASMLEHADSPVVQAGLVTGLLLLGDRRVLVHLEGVWAKLEPEARAEVAGLQTPFAYASLVEWLIASLEGADDASREEIAGLLVRLAGEGRARVLEVTRKFPENARDDRPEIEVIGEWSAPEFVKRHADRLRAIAAREVTPQYLPAILRAWGVEEPSAGTEGSTA